MDLVMDSHSQIVGVGELTRYHRAMSRGELCTCRKKISQCPFWQKIFQGLTMADLSITRNKIDFLFNRKKYIYFRDGQPKKVDFKKYIETNEKIYQNILDASGQKVIFDSSKSPDRLEALLESQQLDITLLHLVRHGQGVAYSYIKTNRPAFSFMKKWAMTNLKIEIIKRRNPVKCIFIKYEHFATHPQEVLTKILNEMGLFFEPAMLNFREKVRHQTGGNLKLRFWERDQKIKLDEQWKTKMPLGDKIIFNLCFGWLNLFYQKLKCPNLIK